MRTPTIPHEEAGGARRTGRLRTFVSRNRKPVAVALIVGAGLAIFGFLWFRPDKLVVNKSVNEALPEAQAAATAAPDASASAAPARPEAVSVGAFRSLEHETRGTARILRLANGSFVVRFEGFRTSNGPDVVVILSDTSATEDEWSAYDDGNFVNIGALKGNVGNQNYTVPRGVDVGRFKSVVVWCRRFNVAFGAAPINLEA